MKRSVLPLIFVFLTLCSTAFALTDEYEKEKAGTSEEQNAVTPAEKGKYALIEWEALVPQNWNPKLPFDGFDLDQMEDNDPRLEQAMEKFKKLWDEAPVNLSLKGRSIKIAGFIVALDYEDKALKEFLLVPYFGACIHSPPPPANQIIYVTSEKPLKGFLSMEPAWVYGTLDVGRNDTGMGMAGYTLKAANVEPYTEK